ncbi:hypothetical protein BV20DRAFT_411013 [Pilatotrama ljubarskyi]|nr:hypothetical protein BV20DRAFT_411013 [Pilatotrama ljubarskyi]
MEGFNLELKAKGTSLDTDSSPATRLPQRPRKPQGAAFEDFGSDFARRSAPRSASQSSQASQGRSKPMTKQPSSSKQASSSKPTIIDFSSDSSEDELDFLSSSSRHGSESPVKLWKRPCKEPAIRTADAPVPLAIDHHQTDPEYKPLNFKTYKIPKKSSSASSAAATPQASQSQASGSAAGPSSSAAHSLPRRPPATSSSENPRNEPGPSNRKGRDHPLRERSPNQDRARPSRKSYLPSWDNSDEEDTDKGKGKDADRDSDKTPRPSRPPAPRPAYKGAPGKVGKAQTVADIQLSSSQESDKGQGRGKGKGKERATQNEKSHKVEHSQSLVDVLNSAYAQYVHSTDSGTAKYKGKAGAEVSTKPKPKPKPKPKTYAAGKNDEKGAQRELDDPITAIFEQRSSSPPRSDKPKAKAVRKIEGKGKQGEPHGPISAILETRTPSPPPPPTVKAKTKVKTKTKRTLSEFPMDLPPSSPGASRASSPPPRSQPKSHRVVHSEDEESDSAGRALRPFPMETQLLEVLKHEQVSPAKRSAAERASDVEDPGGVKRKRPRHESPDKTMDSFALDDSDSGSDLDIFLSPTVDPRTLCPWCDEPLPTHPTPHLLSLIASARRRSYADDRPNNPLGLRAPPAVFVGVCQRHRFERVWVPRAGRRGWPTEIDWGALRGRVEALEGRLRAIVEDFDEDFVPGAKQVKTEGEERRRPRKENEFWQDVVQNVKQQGSRQTTGVRGQFQHFNKTQPGYYGELGYVIIHQTLCDLFPPASFDPAAALPLTPADFIAHVLVPEAALNLIMEDLSLKRADALKTLRESVEYGVAMFPADEGEGGRDGEAGQGILSVGEKIIMERARARRKQLEEEERREEEEEEAQNPNRVQSSSASPLPHHPRSPSQHRVHVQGARPQSRIAKA